MPNRLKLRSSTSLPFPSLQTKMNHHGITRDDPYRHAPASLNALSPSIPPLASPLRSRRATAITISPDAMCDDATCYDAAMVFDIATNYVDASSDIRCPPPPPSSLRCATTRRATSSPWYSTSRRTMSTHRRISVVLLLPLHRS